MGYIRIESWPQYMVTFAACLGSLSAGVSVGWTSPTMLLLLSEESPIPMSYNEFAWVTASQTIGSAISPIVSYCLMDRIGRKPVLIASSVLYILSWVLLIFASNIIWLYSSKILSGLAFGLTMILTPLYIAEISEPGRRGALGVCKTFALSFGILSVSIIAPRVPFKLLNCISMIFPILFLLTFVWMPDTPYYFVSKNMPEEAYSTLMWLRRQRDKKILEDEMESINKYIKTNITLNFTQTLAAIFNRKNRRGLILIMTISFSQFASGLVAISSYAEKIFVLIDSPIDPPDAVVLQSGLSTVAFILTLCVIDRLGRKTLFLTSATGCAVGHALVGTYLFLSNNGTIGKESAWIAMVGLFGYVIFLSLGITSIPYILIGEIFPSETKTWSVCMLSIYNSFMNFIIMKLFQVIDESVGAYIIFYFFATSLLLICLVVIFIMPETKNKTFVEIQDILQGKHKSHLENTK